MIGCNIAIVGAGTTGLASALFLAADGHGVTVFEQFVRPKPVGAGLMLQPTGLACLAALGLDRAVINNSRIIRRIDGRTITGRTVLDIGYCDLSESIFGLGVHRATLFETLFHAVQRADIGVQTSARIARLSAEKAGRWLFDAAGRHYGPFDLVVDASGASSQFRATCGDVRYVKPYPYGAVWGLCDEPADWPWPDMLTQRFRAARKMLGVLPLGTRPGVGVSRMAFFWSMNTNSFAEWRARGIAAWHEEIAGYWPRAATLARQIMSVDDLTVATYPDVVMKQLYGDRIIFLGDAAHSTSPQLGQGANLALVDALVFARVLREGSSLPEAFAAFAGARKSHLRFYQMASRYLTPFFQSDGGAAPAIRDAFFGPMTSVPYLRREMIRTLAGVKTGLFSSLDPGDLHADYALNGK